VLAEATFFIEEKKSKALYIKRIKPKVNCIIHVNPQVKARKKEGCGC